MLMMKSGKMPTWLQRSIKGVLLDVTGVLCNSTEGGSTTIEGSVEAVTKLRAAKIPVRFVSNETQHTRQKILQKLQDHGFSISLNEIYTPAPALCSMLQKRKLRPYLLVHPGLLPEFHGLDTNHPTCVVIGDAAEEFTYNNVNKAFQILMNLENPILFGLGKGKYYKHGNQLQIDLGAYVAALEYSCNVKAEIFGKPSPDFFLSVVQDMNVDPKDVVMIGDDLIHDIGGAQSAGILGVLVRTGKFRPSDEQHSQIKPDAVVDNLAAAVNAILSHSN